MVFKFLVFAAFLAAANAGILGSVPLLQPAPIARLATPLAVAAPIAKAVVAEPYDPNPQYSFGYEVQDPITGDSHGQVETRSGDVVKGSYALLEADGTRRVVDYTADDINGFNAVVSKQPVIAKVAAPIALTAPQPVIAAPAPFLRAAAPLTLGAPLLRAAPLAPLAPSVISGASLLRTAPVGVSVLKSAPLW